MQFVEHFKDKKTESANGKRRWFSEDAMEISKKKNNNNCFNRLARHARWRGNLKLL
jgi:hypothetical protein